MADFPKKQQQCLIPKYLLDYTRELNQNHPDPSDPWGGGGGGTPIEEGTGIKITGTDTKTISIDPDVVPEKTDLSEVAFSGNYNDLQSKPTIPTKTSDLDNDSGFLTDTDLEGYVKAGTTMSDTYSNTLNLDYTGVRFSNTDTSYPYASYDALSVHIVRPRSLYEYAKSVALSTDELYMEYQYGDYDIRAFRVNMAAGEFTTTNLSNYFGNTRITNLGLDTYGQSASINVYDGNMYNCTYYLRKDINGTIATLADLPDLTDYVTSSQLSSALSDYALSSDVTSLANLVSSNTSRISALESGISDCVTLSQLSTTLQDYALSSTVTSLASLVSSNTSAISDLTSQMSNCVTLSQLSTTLVDYATVSSLSSYATLADLPPTVSGVNDGTYWTSITIGSDTYSIGGGGSTPTNMVTTNTAQDITGAKTFLGDKKILFKKSGSNNTLGFTCYDESGKEFANMQAKTRTVGNVSEEYLTLGNYAASTDGYGHAYVGFRINPTNNLSYYNFLAPHGTSTELSAYSTSANNYLVGGITNGSSTVVPSNNGVVNISSLMPSVPTSASTTVTLTPTTETLVFTYSDNTTATITLLASVSASATTTLS